MSEPATFGARTGTVLGVLSSAIALTVIVVAFTQIAGYSLAGYLMLENRYVIFVCGLPFGLIFLYFPRGKRFTPVTFWRDVLLTLTAWACFAVIFSQADRSLAMGYEFGAPPEMAAVAVLLCALVLEGARRAAGLPVLLVVGLAALYPLFNHVFFPNGITFDVTAAASYYVYGVEAIFGVPARTFAFTIIGYLMFGVALQKSGASAFFMALSFSLLGRYRGGAGKVSVISSALLGSMSGSVVSNVLTTGAMTIPAMRKSGLSGSFAGGVEACASTGAVLMPPVMGATAFVMASFIGLPYRDVVIAAIIPSALYYLSLFFQIDAYSARNNVHGLEDAELPEAISVLRSGWHFLVAFALLIYLILTLPNEGLAPFYATAFLLLWTQLFQRRLWSLMEWQDFLEGVVKLFAEITGALLGIGILIGAVGMTGLAATITSQLTFFAGDSLILLLILAACASFLLGFGMPSTPAYIFVAIIVAPALVRQGIDELAAHMFLYYWGTISFITPPVAIAAYAAAGLAGASATAVGLQAVRIAATIYFVPFFFVLNPVLIMKGEVEVIVLTCLTATLGISLLVGGLQGYLIGAGQLIGDTLGAWALPARAVLVAAGLCLMAPGWTIDGLHVSQGLLALLALILATPVFLLTRMRSRVLRNAPQ